MEIEQNISFMVRGQHAKTGLLLSHKISAIY